MLIAGVGTAIVRVPSDAAVSNNAQPVSGHLATDTVEEAKPLDTLASTDVAVHVARLVGLPEATAVVNKADTASAELSISSSDDQVLSKPQIVAASLKSKKDIKTYVTKPGDTVSSVAAQFSITPDTLRFSNGLSGEALSPNSRLTISPVNGMTYVVKPGDTPDSLAGKYNVPKAQLIAFNDAEISGSFKVGETIVIPDAIQPADVRTASYGISSARRGASSSGFSFGSSAIYGGNGYDYGWCTWHAANRRIQIGKPLPTNLGNAISWLTRARSAGLPTAGGVPQAGAVLYHHDIRGLGHVAFVEKVNPDGSILVSDMNYPSWGKVTYRTEHPSSFGNYSFIY